MYKGPIVDCDVHNGFRSPEDLREYLAPEWRDYMVGRPGPAMPIQPGWPTQYTFDGRQRLDAIPKSGGAPGSDPQLTRTQHLDRYDIKAAMLMFNIGQQSGVHNPYYAAALCRASNDWMVERWLAADERFYGSILVPMEVPEVAAAEIRRMAGTPRIKQVLMLSDLLGRPYGHPVYHPIYEAAQECGLSICMHVGNEATSKGRETAGGQLETMFERYAVNPQVAAHYLTSFITHGVFEKYPRLRAMFVEMRVTWLPAISWRLDRHYAGLRRESPYVKRLPSEYIAEHVRMTTQPFDYVPPKSMRTLLETYPAFRDILCFSSDYPHWDNDEPAGGLESRLPRGWAANVFWNNAARLYDLEHLADVEYPSSPRVAS